MTPYGSAKEAIHGGFDPRYIHDEVWDLAVGANGDVFVVAGTGDEYWNYSACNESHLALINGKSISCATLLMELYCGKIPLLVMGEDWAGEAIAYTHDGGLIVAVDNAKFGFLKLLPY